MGRKPKNFVRSRPVPSIAKALATLEFLCSTRRSHTISEIARVFKIPVSTCSSVLYTLVQCGYVVRNDNGGFSLTTKLVTQAFRGLNQIEINDIAEPHMKNLTLNTGLASALFVNDGDQVICIAKVEGSSHIRTAAHIGKQMPMHATCTGKAILAYLPDEEVKRIVDSGGLIQLTANTITSVPLLREELARVRAQGFAIDNQEYGIGVQGISAPVFDRKGKVVAAISAAGPTFELEQKASTVIFAVKAASLEISRTLGYSETIVDNVYRQSFTTGNALEAATHGQNNRLPCTEPMRENTLGQGESKDGKEVLV